MEEAFLAFCRCLNANLNNKHEVERLGKELSGGDLATIETLVGWVRRGIVGSDSVKTLATSVVSEACKSLWILSLIELAGDAMVDAGGVEVLVKTCEVTSDPTVLEMAAGTLNNLACGAKARQELSKCKGMEVLIDLCSPTSEVKLLRAVTGALWVLACDLKNQKQIVELGGVETLLTLLRKVTDGKVAHHSAGILRVLTMSEDSATLFETRRSVWEFGGIGVFKYLLKKKNEDVLEQAAFVIANLAEDDDVRIELVDDGVLELLVGLLGPTLKRSDSKSPSKKALPPIAKKPTSPSVNLRQDMVVEAAASALGMLVFNNEDHQIRAVDIGAIEKLLHTCRTCNYTPALGQCVSALDAAIEDNSTTQNHFVDCGGIDVLLDLLLLSQHVAIVAQTCQTIRRLVVGGHDVRGHAQSQHYDLIGTLNHVLSMAPTDESKQAVRDTLSSLGH